MRQSKTLIATVAVLAATMSVSVFARDHSGGRGGHAPSGKIGPGIHGSHAVSGRAVPGNHGGHGYSGVRATAGHVGPHRHFAGVARIGVVIAAPLYAPLFYPAPSFYYPPPPAYIEPVPTPAYWYFCPELNAYYPYVQECPGVWQPVLPQSPG